MKIAIIADTVHSQSGGAVISCQRFINELQQRHDVIVISTDPQNKGVKLPTLFSSLLKIARRGNFLFAIPNRKAIRAALEDVDIVHLQFPFWLSIVALDEAKKKNLPVVAAFHVQPENILYNIPYIGIRWPWLNRKLYQFWVNKLWNRADLVICPSKFAERKLHSHNLKTPTRIISNGVPKNTHIPYQAENIDAPFFTICMVGRLFIEKKQEICIEAIQLSRYAKKIKLIIVGTGYREKKLKRLLKKLPNPSEIGYVSDERKNHILTHSDLFVHCSEVELECMAVLEAMSAGLPVLIAEGPETAAADFALENFRFPVNNAKALAAKIDWLIENPEKLAEAKILYKKAASNLPIEKSIDIIEQEYHALLKTP